VIDRLLLHYQVSALIGKGGMGMVYKAWDEHLDRWVAIKVLPEDKLGDPARRRRFVQEAKAASSLNHPNIITIHDVASQDNTYFIVMEYIDGRSLSDLIVAGGMPLEDVLNLGIQLADAVAKAHDRGVIHRDLKPSNVLVTEDQRAKILDFGLAKLFGESQGPDVTVTMEGKVLGTAGYMSPEQINGANVGPPSDVFSLGVVLYEMLTGHRPFVGETSGAVMGSILYKDPLPLRAERRDVSADLEWCVLKCLEKEPQRRVYTATDVKRALEAVRGDVSRSTVLHRAPPEPEIPSLAVLPFLNQNSDPGYEYFGEGLAEEIINALTKVRNLRVTARASAFAFHGPNYNIAEIREKLRADYILDGVVRKIGDRVRVTVNLIRTGDSVQVWSERFDRRMTDIFEIQDEISAAVVEKIKGQLGGEPEVSGQRAAAAINVEAYKLYLKGRFYWNRRSWFNLRRGIDCFTEALEHEPLYADAYTGMADSYNLLGYYGERSPREAYSRAKAAAEKALEIDSENAGAHASLGYATLFFDWDFPKSDREFRCALEFDSENARAHHWHAWYFFATRQPHEGIVAMQKAHDRDPLAPIVNDHLALSYSLGGLHDKALAQLAQTIDLDPGFFLAHYRIGWVHLQKGDAERAIAPLERAIELSEGKCAMGMLGYAYGLAGRKEAALATAEKLKLDMTGRYVSPLESALVHAGLGEADAAFASLESAIEERVSDLVLFRSYPWTQRIIEDRRFEKIAQAIGLKK
jgi:serine/threonine protein kinase/tetratricopeptide (TPR) repeat protein